jgi:hypothetical protein
MNPTRKSPPHNVGGAGYAVIGGSAEWVVFVCVLAVVGEGRGRAAVSADGFASVFAIGLAKDGVAAVRAGLGHRGAFFLS